MKDRITTLLTAIAALCLAIFLLNPPASETAEAISLPTTEDRGSAGLKGLYQWLQGNNIPVYPLRNRFTSLPVTPALESKGNLLIMSMPQQRPTLKLEWQALSEWLDAGNSLVILGAAYSTPKWAEDADCLCDIKKLLSRHGWQFVAVDNKTDEEDIDAEAVAEDDLTISNTLEAFKEGVELFTPVDSVINPIPDVAVLNAVKSVRGELTPMLIKQRWRLNSTRQGLALRLFALADEPTITAFWQINNKQKPIYLSLLADVFANEQLDRADNAQLIANIITQNLSAGGHVIFDDYHFGLSDLYDAEQFFSDYRLHQTIAFLGLLWLLYVVGYSNRLAPVQVLKKAISTTDFVEAMAGFFTYRIDKRTLAQELVKHLLEDIRKQRKFSDDDQTWQWLQQHTQLPAAQILRLQKAYQHQRVALDKLTDTITKIRATLLL